MSKNISLNTRLYDPLLAGPLKPLRQAMALALPDDRQTSILDLCCGTGNQLLYFEMRGYRDLHGLDLDPGMIAYAKRNSESICYLEGDASDTGLASGSFDVVTISLALHDKHQDLREAILLETARLLKPNGYVLAADFAFDGNSALMGRIMISAVEFLAGGDHYRNFKDYTRRGGMKKILPERSFYIEDIARVLKNSIGIWKLKKH